MSSPEKHRGHEVEATPIDTSERSKEIQRGFERERSPDNKAERTHEALKTASEQALSSELHRNREDHEAERTGPPTASKTRLNQSFDKTMHHVQAHMSPPARVFSKVIHSPVVEKVSDVVGSTVARPDAILSGSICALILTFALYVTARYIGFELTGSITILAFLVGWLIGIGFDLVKNLFRSKR